MLTTDRPDRAVIVAANTASPADGTTVITLEVIAQIAGIAARRTSGVHAVGSTARTDAVPTGRLRQAYHSEGVSTRTVQAGIIIDVTLIADYPVSLLPLGDTVRGAVLEAVNFHADIRAAEVNVTIIDLCMPPA